MEIVVVESPSKAKTIEKYLGRGYKVLASKGHIVDLPKSTLAIDVDHNFKPDYEVRNPLVLKDLKKALIGAQGLILAVDPDREGEAIGWHIARELKLIDLNGKKNSRAKYDVKRIVFTEITKDAVNQAMQHPRSIDINLVNAQQTRRILDRLVGYKLSPLLWKKLMFGLSAGRVQSVALRLVVEKEEERNAFNSEEYWNLFSYLSDRKSKDPLRVVINKSQDLSEQECAEKEEACPKFVLVKVKKEKVKIINEDQAKHAIEILRQGKWNVANIQSKVAKRTPSAPFNTSTLQQAAASQLGYSASRTMKIAQQLYEHGHITYMRTDSFNIAKQAQDTMLKYIGKKYGNEYLPPIPRVYKTKSKVAQEAHEAIRPADINKGSSDIKITPDQKRLYDLIFKRALASQMADAKVELNKVTAVVEDYEFELEGQKILFPGFYIIHADKLKDINIPNYTIGQELYPLALEAWQKFTEPPARYTEATLIKALEANGIGRPSTYAPILTTIITRKYIEKEGKFLKPTLMGTSLNKLLTDHFSNIVDIGFTAGLEDQLDAIANGQKDWIRTLSDFYKQFNKDIIKGEKVIKKDDYNIVGESDEKCPECGGKMVVKLGRFSPFLSCSKFPKCKGILSLNKREEIQVDITSKDFLSKYKPNPTTDDGRAYILKKSRYGYFWAHPDYPKIKDARALELLPELEIKVYGKAPIVNKDVYVLKKSRFGFFWAHPEYPKKKDIVKINGKEVKERIKDLGLLE